MFLGEDKKRLFFLHSILTEGVFVTHLCSNARISDEEL